MEEQVSHYLHIRSGNKHLTNQWLEVLPSFTSNEIHNFWFFFSFFFSTFLFAISTYNILCMRNRLAYSKPTRALYGASNEAFANYIDEADMQAKAYDFGTWLAT